MITTDDKDLCARAGQTISNLDFLLKREEFKEFIARHQATVDSMEQTILNDDSISHEEREKMRQIRLGMLEVITSPERTMIANRNVIESFYGSDGLDD